MRQPVNNRLAPHGFTLVEILVGLVLGTLAMIIMYQVFAVFENQRRTTVGGADAQSAGHISMFLVERDVRLAGLGLNYIRPTDYDPATVPLCTNGIRTYTASAGGLGWADGNRPVVPVRVTNGTAANPAPEAAFSDKFVVSYMPSAAAVTPRVVSASITTANLGSGIRVSNAPWLNTATGVNALFQKDQHILVGERPTDPTTGPFKHCVRLKISNVAMDSPGDPKSDAVLSVNPGTGYDFNPPTSEYVNFLPVGGYELKKAYVIPSGGTPATKVYRVNGTTNQLELDGTPIAEGVISMQVQYGIGNLNSTGPTRPGKPCSGDGTVNDGSVDPSCSVIVGWSDAIASGFGGLDWSDNPGLQTANTATNDKIRRIKAVRIAVVARNGNLERDPLYTGASPAIPPKASCTAAGDVVNVGGIRICAWRDPAGGTAVPLIDPSISGDEATCAASFGAPCWDRYRYKVYETTIPLRNVIWGTRTI